VLGGSFTAFVLVARGGKPTPSQVAEEAPKPALPTAVAQVPAPPPPPVNPVPLLPLVPPPLPKSPDPAPTPTPPPAEKPAFNFEPLKASIAIVKGKRGHGSGFVVMPNVIATNSHVIRDDFLNDVVVSFIDATGSEQKLKTKLLYQDKPRDLALLLVDPGTKAAPLAINPTFAGEPGKPVTVIGNPAQSLAGVAQVNVVGRGHVASIAIISGKPFFHIRVPTATSGIRVGPGNSGGPVFDESGKVMGVLSAGAMTRDGRPLPDSFCIPAAEVKTAMDSLGPPPGWAGVVEKATAQHVFDIAVVQLSINARFAKRTLEVREDVAAGLAPPNLEARLIEGYKKIDRTSRDLTKPAMDAVLRDKSLPAEVVRDLKKMDTNVDTVRKAMLKAKVQLPEYKRCLAAIEDNDKILERLKDRSGLTDEILREMVKARVFAVLNKLPE
jgi:S1-C subfamily serine protease